MRYELLIDGQLSCGEGSIGVIDPATGEVFEHCARALPEHLELAVAAALRAFDGWSRESLASRQSLLGAIADVIENNAQPLANLLTREQGKPLADSIWEVNGAAYIFRYYANLDIPVQVLEDSPQRRVEQHQMPLGVVGAILPWNFPMFMAAAKIAPTLLAGNTLVLKPAPSTPLTTLHLGALIKDLVPAGVLNLIADLNDLGPLLTAHPDIRKIGFTGSTQTGLKVMGSVVPTLKRLTLELGGNDAAIVLEDCDPRVVATKLFKAAFSNNGQICVALKRLYVPASLYDAVCGELAAIANRSVVGPGLEQGTELGPIQNQAQYERVLSLIESARQDGTIIAGGQRLDLPGYFVRPTIVRDINEGSALVDEEQFGPVLPVIRYQSLDQAIDSANNTQFGLGASVWSKDVAQAYAVAERLDAGTVWINNHGDVGPSIPFGGSKMSGVGAEYAQEGIAELTQLKIINIAKS
ncbi:aldehyde dehydrogenase family protein [Pseudomonas sp. G5(2012)]|uniref:aldehyde dehydrogenase family protein n=1 Tax=Pseudomonas sp. G5(2012) TaxID=1268068 RepID=UPI0003432108|nr:aldehyde dehydrogenase family protein [Pseudomonas sp. G5(2012)]EPA99412.1 aldehyde dehydrogenase [Pseudomonas sp. G5(2012)]